MFKLTTRNSYDNQSIGGNGITPPGFYPAKILAVEPMRSRSGRDMLKLTIEVDSGGARCLEVTDYLILHSDFAWKIEQYLAAVGCQFGAGEEVTIEPRTFLGGKFIAITCNEPGMKHSDRLYLKVYHAVRPQDAPHMGELTPDELKHYGLNSDGTQARSEQRAVAQQQQPQNDPWRNQNSIGGQQQQNWGHQPQNSWQQGRGQQQQQTPADNMADDDIPF